MTKPILHIGDVLPASAAPSYFGPDIQPRWHCVVTTPGRAAHAECRDFIKGSGMFAFYPATEKTRMTRGRRYISEHPEIPGYVFAQFLREPMWHLWTNHRWFTRVFKIGETPYLFDYAQIRHLQGFTVEADRLRRAQDAMQAELDALVRPIADAPAMIVSGPLAGRTITPQSIVGDEALFELFGMKVRAKLSSMRRA